MTEKPLDLFELIDSLPSISEQKQMDEILAENPDLIYDDVPVEDKSPVDIFELLRNVDRGNMNYYASLSPTQKAKFPFFISTKWLSGVDLTADGGLTRLQYVNNKLNVDVGALDKHPELHWKLMALQSQFTQVDMGGGRVRKPELRYTWIPVAKKGKSSVVNQFLLQWYPGANDLELSLLTQNLSRDEFEQFVKSAVSDDQRLKEILKDFDNTRNPTAKKAKAKAKSKNK